MHHFHYDPIERLKIQNPTQLLQSFGLKSGMKILDLGCNNGFYALAALKIIGFEGIYYGVDVDWIAVDNLRSKLKASDFNNYSLDVLSAEDFLLKDYKFDFILLATVLHDFDKPKKVLQNLKKMSDSSTILIDYDFRADKISNFGPPREIRFSLDFASNIIKQAGFKDIKANIYDQNYYLIKARV